MPETINPPPTGDLSQIRADMGHGDGLPCLDADCSANRMSHPVVELPGTTATPASSAVHALVPADDLVPVPMGMMASVRRSLPFHEEVRAQGRLPVGRWIGMEPSELRPLRKRAGSAVVATGERRLHGNLIVRKGVNRA